MHFIQSSQSHRQRRMGSRWRSWQRRAHRNMLQYMRTSLPSGSPSGELQDCVDAAKMPLLSVAYGRVIDAKRKRELANAQRISPPQIPVISVGNFTFGATGKTPCVMFLTEYLLRQSSTKRVPMLLTRGYGDDEWRMFAARFPSCRLAVGSNRLALGTEQAARLESHLSCVLLDDGLQQWKIKKDLEIIMIDTLAPFGNGKLIPHGSLRELPEDAIQRADIVLLHHSNFVQDKQHLARIIAAVRKHTRPEKETIIAKSKMAVVALPAVEEYQTTHARIYDDQDESDKWARFRNKSAMVFCGVGNPESVELVVRGMGCWAHVEVESFPDHHAFSAADLEDVKARADALATATGLQSSEIVLLTTEKDYARSSSLIQRVLGTLHDVHVIVKLLVNGSPTTTDKMSSFRRATAGAATRSVDAATVPAKRALPGTKPFVNGQTLISTGMTQLDAIIGGGWLLGTLVLLDVPRNDAAAASAMLVNDFHRYFLAEAVVAGQCAVVVSDDASGFVTHQLPLELSTAQKQVKAQLAAMDVTSAGEDNKGDQLTIAWQYQKYMAANDGAASKQRFCHSYDLSRPMHAELLLANPPVVLDLSQYTNSSHSEDNSIHHAYARMFADLQDEVEKRTGQQVTRLCLREVGSAFVGAATHEHMRALFSFVRNLRWLCASSRNVVIQMSAYLHAFPVEFVAELRHLSDYVVQVKSFMGENDLLPGELADFDGLLEIKKLARIHALSCHSLDAVKFGIKRERRKMKIEKFHLPPEGSRSSNDKDKNKPNSATSASTTSKSNLVSSSFLKKKSGASGCGSGSNSSVFDPLEF